LRYSYASVIAEVPAKALSDSEVGSLVPALPDPNTGQFFVGPVNVRVVVNGRPSNSLNLSLLALPANTGTVGSTTLAYLDSLAAQVADEKAKIAGIPGISSDQAAALGTLFDALASLLTDFRSQVQIAAGGSTVTAPDGTTYGKDTIDVIDRLLQSAGVVSAFSAQSPLLARVSLTKYLSGSQLPEGAEAAAGASCNTADVISDIGGWVDKASWVACLGSLIPGAGAVLGPICGFLKAFGVVTLVVDIFKTACNIAPINLSSVTISPPVASLPANGSPVQESIAGSFQSTPSAVETTAATLLEVLLSIPGVDKQAARLIASNKVISGVLLDVFQWAMDKIAEAIGDVSLSSLLGFTQTVQITSATSSLQPNPNSLVGIAGFAVGSNGSAGSTNLYFDLSAFRLLDSTGQTTRDSTLVSNNNLPVKVASVVVVSPPSASIAVGAQAAFSATVIGTSNQTVTWDVDGVTSGNSTVGTISTSGLYTAPAVPGGHTVRATSAFDQSTGSGIVTVVAVQTVAVTVSPSTAQVPAGGVQQFTATVTNTSNAAVTWSVNGVTGGNSTVGTTSAAGLYTAPTTVPNPATVTVTATSQAFPSVSSSASVTIGPYTEKPVYSFTSLTDGAAPSAPLIQAEDGNYYGTAQVGGAYGYGTVFKVDSSGNVTPLHEFSYTDGANPVAPLIQVSDGHFYGTTPNGGAYGEGTIFKIDSSGSLTTLYSFTGGSDGAEPSGALVLATDGYFYGVTFNGGDYGAGVVFQTDSSGHVVPLYSFTGGADGYGPEALIQANDGYFYGTTQNGGDLSCSIGGGCGTIFRIDSAGAFTSLYAFSGGTDGAEPEEALFKASDGFLYGTTLFGGDPNCTVSTYTGCGTIFKIDSVGDFTLVHQFSGGAEGGVPFSALIQGGDGDFYGTATAGGDPSCYVVASGENYPNYIGCGTVFKMDSAGNVNALYSFTGSPSDGSNPFATLIEGSDGFLYGTTRWGGTESSCPYTDNGGCGTVFKVSGPAGPLPQQRTSESKRSVTRLLNPRPLTAQRNPVSRTPRGQGLPRIQNLRGVRQPSRVR
jgi:uncharacterized repeat protein (TIGR03803 family)